MSFEVWNESSAALSASDPFDVSQGATIVSNSPTATYAGDNYSDIRSAIGYSNPQSAPSQPVIAYFADGQPACTLDFLTVKTTAAVAIEGFRLFTNDDSWAGVSNANRGFTSITLSGSDDGIAFIPLASGSPSGNSFLSAYGSYAIVATATFTPVSDQFFRLELAQ